MKSITLVSSRINSLSGYLNLKDMLGTKVYSKSGEYIGRVKDVMYMNSQIAGIIVKRNYTRLFFDREYASNVPDDVLFLTIDPVVLLKGKQVFDVAGKYLGRVFSINRPTSKNQFTSLIVKKYFFSRPIEIKASEISTTKKNILLSVSK